MKLGHFERSHATMIHMKIRPESIPCSYAYHDGGRFHEGHTLCVQLSQLTKTADVYSTAITLVPCARKTMTIRCTETGIPLTAVSM